MRFVEAKGFLLPDKITLTESNRIFELQSARQDRNKAKLFKNVQKRERRRGSKV